MGSLAKLPVVCSALFFYPSAGPIVVCTLQTHHRKRTKRFDFEDIAGFIIIGVLSRFIGAFIRTIIIALGSIALLVTIAGGFLTYLLWAIAPLLIIGLFGVSISLFLI